MSLKKVADKALLHQPVNEFKINNAANWRRASKFGAKTYGVEYQVLTQIKP